MQAIGHPFKYIAGSIMQAETVGWESAHQTALFTVPDRAATFTVGVGCPHPLSPPVTGCAVTPGSVFPLGITGQAVAVILVWLLIFLNIGIFRESQINLLISRVWGQMAMIARFMQTWGDEGLKEH